MYILNDQSENETKKRIPFTIACKEIKYQGINLINEMYNFYFKNYKILLKN